MLIRQQLILRILQRYEKEFDSLGLFGVLKDVFKEGWDDILSPIQERTVSFFLYNLLVLGDGIVLLNQVMEVIKILLGLKHLL